MDKKEFLENFDALIGFKYLEAYESNCNIVIRFANDRNVEIDLLIIDGEPRLSEPFAIDNEYLPLDKDRIVFKGCEEE